MARIRTIKPTFFRSHEMAELPLSARLTFIGLWTYVDDAGRGIDDARLVKGDLWQLDEKHTTKKVDADLAMLTESGHIERYEVDGKRYLRVINWRKHQRINRPSSSPIPASLTESTVSPHGGTAEPSPQEREGNREMERGGEPDERRRTHHDLLRPDAAPPLFDELDTAVEALIAEYGPDPVDQAVQQLLDKRLRYPFPSKVRTELVAILGPRAKPTPSDESQRAALAMAEQGNQKIRDILDEPSPSDEERAAFIAGRRAEREAS